MTKAIVIGDGPSGLSAAFFLAKNGIDTTVALDVERTETGVVVDRHARTAVRGLYVVGQACSQTISSAGEGGAAALDILSVVHGKDFNDFNERPKAR